MTYVFVSFNYSPAFKSAEAWFSRTAAYLGILECLAKKSRVINVKQIEFKGAVLHNGVEHHFVKFDYKKSYLQARLCKYIKRLEPDIVFVHGLHQPLQVIFLRLLLSNKTKIIVQHHAEKPFTGLKKSIQQLADKYIDAYLFASHAIGAGWVKNGNISAANKIHEVMEVSSVFQKTEKMAARAKTGVVGNDVFLWVGRLNTNKDPVMVVQAFLKFSKINTNASLYMVYHTDELLADIEALLSRQFHQHVILVGKVPHHELSNWFNSADFFVSGSFYEGSGTAVCEAMSCGCIPIVTDIPAFRMITDNGNCGLLYEAGNEEALISMLKYTALIDRRAKSEFSTAYYESNLSFNAIANRIQTISGCLL